MMYVPFVVESRNGIFSSVFYCPVWPQPNNPSNVLPKQFTLRLPSNQPSSVVYDVIDSDAGRIVSTYPSNSRRTQTFPARPSQVYRYGIRARYSISGQMSPVTSELLLLTPPGKIKMLSLALKHYGDTCRVTCPSHTC